jgi:hypothetical protein
MLEADVASFRQLYAVSVAVQQRYAEMLFQVGNALACRRHSKMALIRAAGDAAAAGDDDEELKTDEIEAGDVRD